MAKNPLPTPEQLRQLLRYEPETGKLFWRERGLEWFSDGAKAAVHARNMWNARWAEAEALTATTANGYLHGNILGVKIMAHRACLTIINGEWPAGDVDHINGIRDDNRADNLRLATRTQNLRNAKKSAKNTSGHTGVYWSRDCQKWCVKIRHGGINHHLGVFATIDEAVAVRRAAETQHGYHPNHGRR